MSEHYRYIYYALKLIFWPLLRLCFPIQIRGLGNIRAVKGGTIIAGNHTGYLDGPLMLLAYPKAFRFLVREEVLSWRVVGRFVKRANSITLFGKSIKSILNRVISELEQGAHICIFPEGKLSRDGHFNKFENGVGFLQQKAQVPVIPFAIHGGFEAWPQGKRFPSFRPITITFGEAIYPEANQNKEVLTQQLAYRVYAMKYELEMEEHAIQQNYAYMRALLYPELAA